MRRFRFAYLLVSLVLVVFLRPFIAEQVFGVAFVDILLLFALIAGVFDDPVFQDDSVSAADRAEAAFRRGELGFALELLAAKAFRLEREHLVVDEPSHQSLAAAHVADELFEAGQDLVDRVPILGDQVAESGARQTEREGRCHR